ncbi:MAG: 50S ribosomal protein L11 methyltransferase [Cellulomonadaceae bacterium]|jgi:ribosomal protein L11 methyltransferase|nr:50S ribosomal protein L11 methyltransferase [Cellulomonadaceae bacterium]
MDRMDSVWHAVTVRVLAAAEEPVSALLAELGAVGIAVNYEVADAGFSNSGLFDSDPAAPRQNTLGFIEITGYFSPELPLEEISTSVSSELSKLGEFVDLTGVAVSTNYIAQSDWSDNWKQYYRPARISRFLTIIPSWTYDYPPTPGELVIRLDPGMSFGTGTHPTTVLALHALEQVLRGGETVIDVGTGSGVLAIAAVLLGAAAVLAIDSDPEATQAATQNISSNGLIGSIMVQPGSLLAGITAKTDVIIANILADVLVQLIGDAANLLNPGGYLILSGIYHDKIALITAEVERCGLTVQTKTSQNEWHSLIATTPSQHLH